MRGRQGLEAKCGGVMQHVSACRCRRPQHPACLELVIELIIELIIELVNSMWQVAVAEAKAQLSSLLDAVERGEPVLITRRGRAVAELVPRRAVRDLLPSLQALRTSLPVQASSAVDTLRALRDGAEP